MSECDSRDNGQLWVDLDRLPFDLEGVHVIFLPGDSFTGGATLIEDDLEVLVDLEQNGVAVILRNSDHVLMTRWLVYSPQSSHERSGRSYLDMRHIG